MSLTISTSDSTAPTLHYSGWTASRIQTPIWKPHEDCRSRQPNASSSKTRSLESAPPDPVDSVCESVLVQAKISTLSPRTAPTSPSPPSARSPSTSSRPQRAKAITTILDADSVYQEMSPTPHSNIAGSTRAPLAYARPCRPWEMATLPREARCLSPTTTASTIPAHMSRGATTDSPRIWTDTYARTKARSICRTGRHLPSQDLTENCSNPNQRLSRTTTKQSISSTESVPEKVYSAIRAVASLEFDNAGSYRWTIHT